MKEGRPLIESGQKTINRIRDSMIVFLKTIFYFVPLNKILVKLVCVVGVLAQYGCCRIIQVDAAHWWWLRRFPLPFKAL